LGRRPKRLYIVRTPVPLPPEPRLEAGPPPPGITRRRYLRMLSTLAQRQPDLTVLLENLCDPGNLGAVLRTCEAVGVGTVHLLYTIEERPRIAPRAAGSAQRWLRIQEHRSVEEAYAALRSQGMRIYATAFAVGALQPHEVDWTQPAAIVLGNENRGVSREALEAADGLLYIPMRGMVQSVNVSVAAAMLLYEAQRQRAAAGYYDAPRLPESEWRALLESWLKRERRLPPHGSATG
jgi:tRNA (guanosine-2'-O-)-methyltransferase